MPKKGLSQEMLKLIACITMLVDHIGATLVPVWGLRVIGRVAFPIYCFLLAEGAFYTRSPKKYALRLMIGMILSELPFDLALYGRWYMGSQSVMVTLLLGYFALLTMGKVENILLKLLVSLPFQIAAELLMTDYGGSGVLLIVLFGITRDMPWKGLIQLVGMALICGYLMPGAVLDILGFSVAIELFALAALPLIACYRGHKSSGSKVLQWSFYLFYPAHLLALYAVRYLLLW